MKTQTIEIDDDIATVLKQRAQERGVTVPELVAELVTLEAGPVGADAADIAELDRRWKAFEAQGSVADSEDVVRWLQTWGIVMVSIPLSILTSIAVLAALGQTLNTMTLGGLALAVGILVDDSTVTIENTHRLLPLSPERSLTRRKYYLLTHNWDDRLPVAKNTARSYWRSWARHTSFNIASMVSVS